MARLSLTGLCGGSHDGTVAIPGDRTGITIQQPAGTWIQVEMQGARSPVARAASPT